MWKRILTIQYLFPLGKQEEKREQLLFLSQLAQSVWNDYLPGFPAPALDPDPGCAGMTVECPRGKIV